MAEPNNGEMYGVAKSVLGWVAGAFLMIVTGMVGMTYTDLKERHNKLEERVLILQKDSITEDKLRDTEARINSNLQREVGFIRQEMSQQNKLLERVIEKLDNRK